MKKLNKLAGQTLIEALVTLVFITVSVIALIRFQNYLAYDTSVAQQTNTARLLAVSQIETLRDYQVINNTPGYTSYQSIASGSGTASSDGTNYTITYTVTTYTNPNYKNLDVSVTWTSRYGTSQSVRLISNVAQLDPQDSAAIM